MYTTMPQDDDRDAVLDCEQPALAQIAHMNLTAAGFRDFGVAECPGYAKVMFDAGSALGERLILAIDVLRDTFALAVVGGALLVTWPAEMGEAVDVAIAAE